MAESLAVRARVVRPSFTLDVDFTAVPGVHIVFGRSGAGKSTLLSVVAGLVEPSPGVVRLGDQVLSDTARRVNVPVHARRVGYVFQSLALFPHLSVLDNVAYGLREDDRARRAARARATLERLCVGHVADRRPTTLSGGEAQRVALARVFASEPRVLLMDEPFSALDRDLRRELAREVRSYVDEAGIPALFVTHHRREARSLGDRLLVLDAGRVVHDGAMDDRLLGED